MKNPLIIFLLFSFTSFGQSSINGARVMPGTIPETALASTAIRPSPSGELSDFELEFGPLRSKSYTLNVTSDITLSLDDGFDHTSESNIYIYASGDGSHTLNFPADWVFTERSLIYNPNKIQRVFLEYIELPTPFVFITIEHMADVVIPTLSEAVIVGGTDDVTLTFTEAVTITTAGWTLSASGGAVTVSSVVSGSGTATVVFDLSRNITAGEDVTMSYDPMTGSTVSETATEIAAISNFFVDTGDEELPDNSITVDDSGGKDYTTITAASNAATAGQTVVIYSGTYRETVPGKSGVTYQPAPGETPIIDGRNLVTDSWTVHSGNIYKATITGGLPVDNTAGYNLTISESNTTLFNNQVFKDNTMQFEARYPNITDESDLLEFTGNMRHYSDAVGDVIGTTSVVDNGIPVSGLTGAKMPIHGWFWNHMRTVTSQPSTNTLNFANISNSDGLNKYRHWWYVCGKLVLLDTEKEWAYDPATNILYLWQTGGGSPTNISYKARNWGFDLRGVDNVTIKGITFIGCEVAHGSTTTDNCTIDNVRATYTNHDVMYEDLFPGYGNATETGTQLLGVNNVVKNSEFRYTAAHGIFVGTGGIITNNLYQDCGYDGSWGAPFSFAGANSGLGTSSWPDADDVTISYNTVSRTGRSAVDMSPSYTSLGSHSNLNIEVAYNDFSGWGMINVDLGAVYSWGFRNLTGSSYHHNWYHDDGVLEDPTGAALHGGQYCEYQDQASGPVTHHHNIYSANWTGLPTNAGDTYNQPNYEHRNAGSSMYYNNTYASTSAPYSHKLSVNAPKDIWRNNIFVQRINNNWGNAGVADEQYNLFDGEITGTTITAAGTGTVKNADFSGTNIWAAGSESLAYIPSTGSIARNTGTVLTGITDVADDAGFTDDGTPDKGARAFGATQWVPGYVAVALDDDVYIEDNNLVFTSYSVSPTVQSDAVYHGGTSSFFNTDEAFVEITIPAAATAFEWYAEKFEHSGSVEVQIDGVRQDCDTGTGGTQDCDLYVNATTKNSTLIFSKTGLGTSAQKVIKLINKAVGAEGGQYVTHDAVKYEQ